MTIDKRKERFDALDQSKKEISTEKKIIEKSR
jgi:hypothetical protein